MVPRLEVRYLWYPCGSLGGFVETICAEKDRQKNSLSQKGLRRNGRAKKT